MQRVPYRLRLGSSPIPTAVLDDDLVGKLLEQRLWKWKDTGVCVPRLAHEKIKIRRKKKSTNATVNQYCRSRGRSLIGNDMCPNREVDRPATELLSQHKVE